MCSETPPDVVAQIFPWVEDELKALKMRIATNPLASDLALERFLGLLKDMRQILVQDLAALFKKIPTSYIYSCVPFNSTSFRQFAHIVPGLIEESEKMTKLALQNLPEVVIQTVSGTVGLSVMTQKEESAKTRTTLHSLEATVNKILGSIEYMQYDTHPRKRRKLRSNDPVARKFFF